jgi:PKD repeat protein
LAFVKSGTSHRVAGWVFVVASAVLTNVFTPAILAQTCPSNIPHVQGVWRTLPYLAPINPISATLLHTGKILIVAGSENDANNNSPGAESYRNAVWDPAGADQSSITVQSISYDVFCSGTVALPDGRSLVIGGTSDYSFKGDNRASIFDPGTSRFLQSQSMVDGRWYGTATTLGDGRVMAFSGLNLAGGTNNTVEIYDVKNAGAGWTSPVTAPFSPPLYPRMFLLPTGKIFYNGQGGGGSNASGWIFDPASPAWTQSAATTRDRTYGSAVLLPLLPPSYTPKVMNFGGGPNPASATTEIIDLSLPSPSWSPGPSMSTGRIQMNAVILPNGKVLAEGGSVNNESPSPAGKQADLYDPVTNSITSAGSASYSRLYHSVALLLPDATVASMGSNPGPRGNYEPAIEIYTPPYLFDANDRLITSRPRITGVSAQVVGYSTQFSVTYTSASAISSAVLVRPGSSTHAFDMDQRLIGLCGPAPQPPCSGSGTLNLTTPLNGNIAPAGYYMLFLLDATGVPSIANFIQLSPYATPPPSGVISSPASDVTITAGTSVSFSTTSSGAKYSWVFPGGSLPNSSAQAPPNITFNTPGTYVTSLTVIDAAGNSDPSPPTRTITVLQNPDFDISVSPSSQTLLPGQSAAFTVTVTPRSGFNGTVSLSVSSESGFPSGITSGGFNPASISSGGGVSTLTMNTATSAVPNALSLTISGSSGMIAHTASTTLLVGLAPPANFTATPGSGQVLLTWQASAGATSYHVKSALVSGGPYTGIACTTATTFTNTGLSSGTPYYYVASAAYQAGPNAGGESADSGETTATPGAASPPPAPTNVKAATGNPKASVNVTWTQSTGGGITQNSIYRRTNTGSYPSSPTATISAATSYVDMKLTSGATYCYLVSAVSSAGGPGAKSQPEACGKAK